MTQPFLHDPIDLNKANQFYGSFQQAHFLTTNTECYKTHTKYLTNLNALSVTWRQVKNKYLNNEIK